MKLQRKLGKSLIDATGQEYPNAIVTARNMILNNQHNLLQIDLNCFVDYQKYLDRKAPLSYHISPLMFDDSNTPPMFNNISEVTNAIDTLNSDVYNIINRNISFGRGDTRYVISDMLDLENNCSPQNDVAKLWLMEQLDHEGIPFYVNWEFVEENEAKFNYLATLNQFLKSL